MKNSLISFVSSARRELTLAIAAIGFTWFASNRIEP